MFSASFRESSNQGTVRAVFSLPLFTGKRNFTFGRRIHLSSCRDFSLITPTCRWHFR